MNMPKRRVVATIAMRGVALGGRFRREASRALRRVRATREWWRRR
jgi:hypothetical protein